MGPPPFRLVRHPARTATAGAGEGNFTFAAGHQTFGEDFSVSYGMLEVNVRGRSGAVEPYGGVDFLPLRTRVEQDAVVPVFQRVYVGARVDYPGREKSFTGLTYRALLLVAVSENADVVPFVGGGGSLDEMTGWSGGVGFRLR